MWRDIARFRRRKGSACARARPAVQSSFGSHQGAEKNLIEFQVNESTENIGARRLHTVLERLLDEISYRVSDESGQHHVVDPAYVDERLATLVKDEDLSRYIL